MTMTNTRFRISLAAFALVAVACSKESAPAADTTTAATAVPTPDMPAALAVIDIDMGRKLDAEKKIADKTDDFMPKDTIFASVHTSGAANNAAVIGKWTFEDGTVVDSTTQMVSPTGDAYTAFHIAKATGFPKGKYTVHIFIDGKEVRTKDVTVK
jgi:hypothetical protein